MFVADAGGVSNVYRLDPSAGTVHRLTNEQTGASGRLSVINTATNAVASVAVGSQPYAAAVHPPAAVVPPTRSVGMRKSSAVQPGGGSRPPVRMPRRG